jgi:catalase
VQRTFLTTRSVEFDAVLLGGSPSPAPDAKAARDVKAGAGEALLVDPRLRLIVEEAFRHSKVIGAWGRGVEAVTASGCLADDVGIVTGDDAEQVLAGVLERLGQHRVWERFRVDA